MKQIKLGVTGTRYGISKEQFLNVQAWLEKPIWGRDYELIEFHHGDCVGADIQIATVISQMHPQAKIVCHPPTKDKHRGYFESDETLPERGYFERNRILVDSVDMLIAFPIHRKEEEGGTWYTVKYAQKKKVRVGIFHYDGTKESR